MKLIFALALFQVSPCDAQQAKPTAQLSQIGTITGTITGSDGAPIKGASVGLWLQPPYSKDKFFKTQQVTTSLSDGAFSFDRLIAGAYRLCVHVPSTAWLNPCEWGPQAPLLTISDVDRSVKVPVVLKVGALVTIRVDDPSQLLMQHEGRTPGAHLLIGLSNDANAFVPAQVLSRDSGGTNRQVLIPYNAQKSISVFSSIFRLSDQADVPVAGKAITIPVIVAFGASALPIRIRVTGVSK